MNKGDLSVPFIDAKMFFVIRGLYVLPKKTKFKVKSWIIIQNKKAFIQYFRMPRTIKGWETLSCPKSEFI